MAEEQRQDSEISGTIAMAKTEDDDDAGISQVEEATRDEPVPVVKIDSYRDSHHINLTWRSWMVVLCVSREGGSMCVARVAGGRGGVEGRM